LTARSAPNRLVRPETLNIAMRGIPLARVPDAVQRETVHRRSGAFANPVSVTVPGLQRTTQAIKFAQPR
jgi:hypothetical protein